MALWIEFGPPFVWLPRIERAGPVRGLVWAWLRIARIPGDINSFVQNVAQAGVEIDAEARRADGQTVRTE